MCLTNPEFQELIESDSNIDKIKDIKFKDIYEKIKAQVTADIKQKLLLQLEIHESEMKRKYKNPDRRDVMEHEWNFFRKIINDL